MTVPLFLILHILVNAVNGAMMVPSRTLTSSMNRLSSFDRGSFDPGARMACGSVGGS
ncbi:hypothetical protein HanXRQr2_Chr09g0410961 [Helianthus annuus]|uniref:Uncharacterized protein n=1 Tax=Helianthus annuus TaxID=4232 RepID=A0A9K3NA21_HELAN|nr:hypothetical protein HanXRQr2_Chr09g0410961 [Helianthus annuus]KAJ0895135.1 hypothetical protein HanPSC8_Chr09g0396961 [Helianthus annuus]